MNQENKKSNRIWPWVVGTGLALGGAAYLGTQTQTRTPNEDSQVNVQTHEEDKRVEKKAVAKKEVVKEKKVKVNRSKTHHRVIHHKVAHKPKARHLAVRTNSPSHKKNKGHYDPTRGVWVQSTKKVENKPSIRDIVRSGGLERLVASNEGKLPQGAVSAELDLDGNGVYGKFDYNPKTRELFVNGHKVDADKFIKYIIKTLDTQSTYLEKGKVVISPLNLADQKTAEGLVGILGSTLPSYVYDKVATELALNAAIRKAISEGYKSAGENPFKGRDSRLTYISPDGKTNLSDNHLIESPKKYSHRPTIPKDKRAKVGPNPTELVREFNSLSPMAQIIAYENMRNNVRNNGGDVSNPVVTLESLVQIGQNIEHAMAKDRSLSDWGKMVLGIGSYGSTFLAVKDSNYRPFVDGLTKAAKQGLGTALRYNLAGHKTGRYVEAFRDSEKVFELFFEGEKPVGSKITIYENNK